MELRFEGDVWEWRGPAPFHFVTVPAADAIADVASLVTYGWGMIPVTLTVGRTTVTTSLWPRDGTYVVPIKKRVQDAEHVRFGDRIEVCLELVVRAP